MSVKARYDGEWAGWKADPSALVGVRRFQQVCERIIPLRPQRMLDVGCGDGRLARLVKNSCQGVWIAGCDISEVALARADSLDQAFTIDLDHGAFPIEDHTMDVVTFSEVLEHLVEPRHALAEARRVLRPSGRVLVTVPNFAFWRFRLHALSGAVPPITADERHFHSYNADSLARLLTEAGFAVVDVTGLRERFEWLGRIAYRLLCDTLVVEAQR